MKHDVVITGLGLLSALGCDETSFVAGLSQGGGRFRPWPEGEVEGLSVAPIRDFVFRDWVTTRNKRTKKMDRVSQFASTAALLALRDAGLLEEQGPLPEELGRDFGIVTGSALAVLESIALFHGQLAVDGPDRVDPKVFPNTSHNVPCAHVTIEFGLRGPMVNLCSGPASGGAALLTAWRMLRRGRAKRLLVGGFDHLGDTVLKALLPSAGKLPPLGEGAAFLVLETAEGARERGARVRGHMLGGCMRSWVSDPTKEAEHGPWADCLEMALARCESSPQALSLCVGGSLGLADWDRFEARGLEAVCPELPVFPLKRHLGECMASFGVFGAATAVLALEGKLDGLLGEELRRRGSGPILVSDPDRGTGGAVLLLAGSGIPC